MNTSATMDDLSEQGSNGTHRFGRYAKRSAERVKHAGSPDFGMLIADVEDLLQKVGHLADSEVVQVRERLRERLADVKEGLTNRRTQIAAAARNAAGATDDYVHDYPWHSTGVAAVAGVLLGYILFKK
jgi:ElaB/YqjD/DUF883 family membrane-anchored ribosome-binding protein